MGRLVRDSEIRFSSSGIAVASITIAANRRWKSKSGEIEEETAFVPCVVFGPPAEWTKEHRKGESLIVAGHLRTDSWQREGTAHSRLILVVDEIQFVERKRGNGNSNGDSNGTVKEGADAPAADMPVKEKHPVPF
jgi:single-strand DNA-binding protein